MLRIHIEELRKLLTDKGYNDPNSFVGIDFASPTDDGSPAFDDQFANKVLTVNSVYGLVTITFNHRGYVVSIDVE
jgi:hypothetical protein